MMSNKRSRAEMEDSIVVTMAKCLMLLSRDKGGIDFKSVIDHQQMTTTSSTQDRVFECKTCNKRFLSFQALGGHRASHKTRPVMDLYSSDDQRVSHNQKQANKVKIHECSICGLNFAAGQALGGHMRRHRAAMIESSTTTAGTGLSSEITAAATHQKQVVPQVSVLKRSHSRRVLSFNMDLDLSLSLQPLDNNDLEFSTDYYRDMMMSNKRSRREMEESMAATMEKCLSLLSNDNGDINYQSVIQQQRMPTSTRSRLYECKTCNKQFPSFQALGGHRASHKKPRLMELYSSDDQAINDNQQQAKKQKIHGCSICGLKFPIGQALGGHMRKHRAAMIESSLETKATAETTTTGLSSSSSDDTNISFQEERLPQVPVLKRSNSSRRVLSLNLDLSLSLLPCDSNDFEFSTIYNRNREEMEESIAVTMAKCFMLLSLDRTEVDYKPHESVLQTCNKQFPSFKALGGHRASHKKQMMSNKRSRGEMEESMAATMEKCLMLLSRDRGDIDYQSVIQQQKMPSSIQGRIYECKTCDKQFPSFQALGGHRASHKKPRLMELYSSDDQVINDNQQKAKKQKVHGCSICGLTFSIGQALGGHMRKHRAAMIESSSTTATAETTTTGSSSSSSDNTNISFQEERLQVPVLKRLNSSRRVLSLNLDLSLSLLPSDNNNDFEFSTIVNADKHMPSSPSMIYSFI
ncbi:hypothetical protein MKX03_025915 [Papaver bracteatum]|nr:hypothetical protein MKX03_025915 [Papaver bracteatum]